MYLIYGFVRKVPIVLHTSRVQIIMGRRVGEDFGEFSKDIEYLSTFFGGKKHLKIEKSKSTTVEMCSGSFFRASSRTSPKSKKLITPELDFSLIKVQARLSPK